MNSKINAIIVEDEEPGIVALTEKLKRSCPMVEIIKICRSAYEAVEEIPKYQPELLFLDINLGSLNGFDVLSQIHQISFEVIFTTSYNQYAIDAIRKNALDYLLKPIDEKELARAVLKAQNRIRQKPAQSTRVAIPVTHGLRFIDVAEILYCEADDNRTIIHLFNRKKIRTSRVLSKIQEMLEGFSFIRIHRSYLINKEYLEEFNRTDGRHVIMHNGDRLPVSRADPNLFS